jgi:phosphatidylinositol-3-phosphatase
VLENKEVDDIVGNANAPYINSLLAAHGSADAYFGIRHPSQPNYLALVSGDTQGVTDDDPHDVNAPNLADQLEAAGKTWRVFAQNVPAGCFTGASASGGPDGKGTYARKHEPFISFTSISGNAARCANITDFSHFDPAAADFELIVPNQTNSMHDGTVAQGDAFLRDFVPRILDSPAYQQDGLLVITWDEGSSDAEGGGQVPTLVISPRTPAGTTVETPFNHYALLRTIEDAWGLGCLANACDAPNMAAFFR